MLFGTAAIVAYLTDTTNLWRVRWMSQVAIDPFQSNPVIHSREFGVMGVRPARALATCQVIVALGDVLSRFLENDSTGF